MSLESAFYSRIVSDAPVAAALVGRLYPIALPERPIYPAATYQRGSGRSVQAHSTGGKSAFASMQVTVFAETRERALEVVALIKAALEPGRWEADGIFVYSCWMVDSFDLERDTTARIEGVGHVYDIMHS